MIKEIKSIGGYCLGQYQNLELQSLKVAQKFYQ